MIRRFTTTRFNGSSGPNPREANCYTLSIFGRRERRIVAVAHAYTLADLFALARAARARYPGRLIGIGREQYSGGGWIAPHYRRPGVAPDYRAARISRFTDWQRRGRRWVRAADIAPWDLLAVAITVLMESAR